MAHWAELDENNVVTRVVVGDNNDPAGDEGYSWIVRNLGGRWLKTSYNGNIRKNFAGIGSTYNEELDAFVHPQPYPSWVLNDDCVWTPLVPAPEDMVVVHDDGSTTGSKFYLWNEDILNWELNPNRTLVTVFEDSFIDE